ncbi:DNA polymerase/3'-5' exonuclease PolX [Cupriavidus sp. WKF15]|uniref:DNA polymerase/3'-5' exonuclease PolX n=1 Tax=Cupriavidus sp. WKF15 TaxID=3032282 RepID=UPI0023E2446A|nr:DNA polymerase/3'-5' exonuclease PolX [Cupriavidus sp. WKF15]WER50923.1 DNA polymerase/3'-5' exonuclease PolX [Cupriavidus sp. WKF15]
MASEQAPVLSQAVIATFTEIADLLDISGANPFRVRAYRNAARTVSGLREDLRAFLAHGGDLTDLPGIGEDLAGKIREIADTGTCALLSQVHGEVPGHAASLLKLPGLGPRRVQTLQRELHISSMDDLARAAREHQISSLSGFGPRSEQRLLQAIQAHLDRNRRFNLDVAGHTAEPLLRYLHDNARTTALAVAGSFRRGRDTVGDLDIVAASTAPRTVIRAFVSYPMTQTVISAGVTRASLLLSNGMQVDLRVVPPEDYGAALVYLTGSKAHNVALRQLAQSQGLKMNEYGVFRGRSKLAGQDEASVYAAVGLPWIPPELREDTGELQAAREGTLPQLVTAEDLKGDLHVHTRDSDGLASLEEMVQAAGRLGFQYLAITDHSPRMGITHGLGAERLAAQADRIDALNAAGGLPVVLKGVEVDILEDGSLDLPDAVLGRLDLVVGAIHSHFDLPAATQTARILRAIEHPHFSILAHPSGRLLGERDACRFDLPRVMKALAERGCFVEANSQPSRLDLWDSACRMAGKDGVLVSIASDAHRVSDLDNLPLGLAQARRGWLEAADVLNARPLAELRRLLGRTM